MLVALRVICPTSADPRLAAIPAVDMAVHLQTDQTTKEGMVTEAGEAKAE
jgi:hypothetical protein